MKIKLGNSQTWGLVGRVLCGALFTYSGFSKLIQPKEYFEIAIYLYELSFLDPLTPFLSLLIPWAEFIFGTYLLLGFALKIAAPVLAALSFSFQILLGQALLRNLNIDECGCFGGGFHLTLYQSFLLDTVLLLILIKIMSQPYSIFSVDQFIQKKFRPNPS